MSKQKYNKNEFKEENATKFFSNERINRKFLSSLDSKNLKKLVSKNNTTANPTHKGQSQDRYALSSLSKTRQITERSERHPNIQTARSNTADRIEIKLERCDIEKKERSKSRSLSKMKKLKLKSPSKQLATNLWNAYFMDTLEKKEIK